VSDVLCRTLGLLSVESVVSGAIDAAWRAGQVDRRMRTALAGLLDLDLSMVQLIRERTRTLSVEEIRSSLQRARISVEFGMDPRQPEPEARQFGSRRSMSGVELRIATWLQQRALDRWSAGGGGAADRHRSSQRRSQPLRRSETDRRNGSRDRRRARMAVAPDRRNGAERRRSERRMGRDRRVVVDRRVRLSLH
jgi:hypothetical protein